MKHWVIPFFALLFLVGCGPTIVQNVQNIDSTLGQNRAAPAQPKAEAPLPEAAAPEAPAEAAPVLPDLPAFEMPESSDGTSEGMNPVTPMVPEADISEVAHNNNDFALDILEILRADNSNSNIIYSPVSIYTAFAMLYAGAGGETATQIAEVLHYDVAPEQLHPAVAALEAMLTTNGKEGFTLNIANSIWSRQSDGFTIDFVDTLSRHYRTAIQWLDFAGNPQGAADAVNQWVNQVTQGKIPSMVDSFDPATELVLANAIYFNAEWATPFEKNATRPAPFTALDGSSQTVPMMQVTDGFAYAEGENYQIVALPYAGGSTRMVVLLPAAGEFAAFEQSVTSEMLAEIMADMDSTTRQVALTFPQFEYESTTDLVQVLEQLGLTLPFGDQADFSGINGTGGLAVDQAIHKATITVDENGTEAAAATVVAVTTLSMPLQSETVTMTVDRPFLYFIQDSQSGALLFVGRIVNLNR